MKIYLSPSNQSGNKYAYGNTNEMEQCNRIADAAKNALERCGFTVKKAPKGQDMRKSINESNSWGADLHIPIHTNAFDGKASGTIVFVYSKNSKNMKYANPIYQEVQSACPGKTDYGVRENPELAELNSTNATAVYVEADFHDNPAIAKWITENPNAVGEAIAKGVCKGAGVTYKAPSTTSSASKPTQQKIYRVQVGAYSEKKNAEAFLERVKAAGFINAFIVEVDKK